MLIPTTSARPNAAIVSSSVAEPFSTMIDVTLRSSLIVVPEIESEGVTEVSEVLLDEGLVEARGLAPRVQLLLGDAPAERCLDGIAGATRIRPKTIVRRIRTVGIARASRVRTYARRDVPCEFTDALRMPSASLPASFGEPLTGTHERRRREGRSPRALGD